MQRYILIDEHSGFVWGDCYAETPVSACQRIDESIDPADGRLYTDIGREPFSGRSGYHVHIAPTEFPSIYDGQEQAVIDAVSEMPLASRVVVASVVVD